MHGAGCGKTINYTGYLSTDFQVMPGSLDFFKLVTVLSDLTAQI